MAAAAKPVFPPIGMGPDVWGPIFWTTMHIVTLGYPDAPSKEDQKAAIEFFNSLAGVIPCPICRTHYSHFLTESPVSDAVSNRQELIFWLFNLHNKVNTQLNKPTLSFQQFINNMRALAASGHTALPCGGIGTTTFVGSLVVAAAVGAAAYYFYRKNFK